MKNNEVGIADTGAIKFTKQVPSTAHLRLISMESLWKFETFIRGIHMELGTL